MSDSLLEGRALRCVRDQRLLFEQLDLDVPAGALVQIEGVNGAGKTSLLRILCGLSEPDAGEVLWRGGAIRDCRPEYHAELLYLGHQPALKDDLTPLENLRFFQSLNGFEADPMEALDRVGLFGFEDQPVRSLSAGQRRRVALARLWLDRATLWLLDEPFTAIDRHGITQLEQRLHQHRTGGGAAVLTSHQPLALDDITRLVL